MPPLPASHVGVPRNRFLSLCVRIVRRSESLSFLCFCFVFKEGGGGMRRILVPLGVEVAAIGEKEGRLRMPVGEEREREGCAILFYFILFFCCVSFLGDRCVSDGVATARFNRR